MKTFDMFMRWVYLIGMLILLVCGIFQAIVTTEPVYVIWVLLVGIAMDLDTISRAISRSNT